MPAVPGADQSESTRRQDCLRHGGRGPGEALAVPIRGHWRAFVVRFRSPESVRSPQGAEGGQDARGPRRRMAAERHKRRRDSESLCAFCAFSRPRPTGTRFNMEGWPERIPDSLRSLRSLRSGSRSRSEGWSKRISDLLPEPVAGDDWQSLVSVRGKPAAGYRTNLVLYDNRGRSGPREQATGRRALQCRVI